MARIFNWQITRDGQTKSGSTKFEGDIYIIMEQEFGVEDFCMEMLAWCEEAKDGDVYDDGEVKVECVCE